LSHAQAIIHLELDDEGRWREQCAKPHIALARGADDAQRADFQVVAC
jgi:hypothetical protein